MSGLKDTDSILDVGLRFLVLVSTKDLCDAKHTFLFLDL